MSSRHVRLHHLVEEIDKFKRLARRLGILMNKCADVLVDLSLLISARFDRDSLGKTCYVLFPRACESEHYIDLGLASAVPEYHDVVSITEVHVIYSEDQPELGKWLDVKIDLDEKREELPMVLSENLFLRYLPVLSLAGARVRLKTQNPHIDAVLSEELEKTVHDLAPLFESVKAQIRKMLDMIYHGKIDLELLLQYINQILHTYLKAYEKFYSELERLKMLIDLLK